MSRLTDEALTMLWDEGYQCHKATLVSGNRIDPIDFRQKALTKAKKSLGAQLGATFDPFDFVEPCVPECSDERHAYHKGQWDMATRIKQGLESEAKR